LAASICGDGVVALLSFARDSATRVKILEADPVHEHERVQRAFVSVCSDRRQPLAEYLSQVGRQDVQSRSIDGG
jgi:hypothetical protein